MKFWNKMEKPKYFQTNNSMIRKYILKKKIKIKSINFWKGYKKFWKNTYRILKNILKI